MAPRQLPTPTLNLNLSRNPIPIPNPSIHALRFPIAASRSTTLIRYRTKASTPIAAPNLWVAPSPHSPSNRIKTVAPAVPFSPRMHAETLPHPPLPSTPARPLLAVAARVSGRAACREVALATLLVVHGPRAPLHRHRLSSPLTGIAAPAQPAAVAAAPVRVHHFPIPTIAPPLHPLLLLRPPPRGRPPLPRRLPLCPRLPNPILTPITIATIIILPRTPTHRPAPCDPLHSHRVPLFHVVIYPRTHTPLAVVFQRTTRILSPSWRAHRLVRLLAGAVGSKGSFDVRCPLV